jgi:hypothetical protein
MTARAVHGEVNRVACWPAESAETTLSAAELAIALRNTSLPKSAAPAHRMERRCVRRTNRRRNK